MNELLLVQGISQEEFRNLLTGLASSQKKDGISSIYVPNGIDIELYLNGEIYTGVEAIIILMERLF
jgi:hypothetical protein